MATAKSRGSSGSKSRSSSSGGRAGGSKSTSGSKAAASARSSKRTPGRTAGGSASSSKTNPNARSGSRAGASRARSGGGGAGGRSRSQAGSQTTTDHDQIRQWADARGGKPSCVRGTGGGGDTGMLRIDFPGYSGGGSLQEISWDEFFEKFDEQGLALLYQETTKDGQRSNFNKLVSRETANAKKARGGSRSGSKGASASRSRK